MYNVSDDWCGIYVRHQEALLKLAQIAVQQAEASFEWRPSRHMGARKKRLGITGITMITLQSFSAFTEAIYELSIASALFIPLDPKTKQNEGFKPPKNMGDISPKNEGFTWVPMVYEKTHVIPSWLGMITNVSCPTHFKSDLSAHQLRRGRGGLRLPQ